MLNDSQMQIFRSLADNRALFEALKEYFEEKFTTSDYSADLTNEQLGQIARAQYEGLKRIESAFNEIASCKSSYSHLEIMNPAK